MTVVDKVLGDMHWPYPPNYTLQGRKQLEEFAGRVVLECLQQVRETPQDHAYTSYDLSMIKSTTNKIIKHIEQQLL